MRDVDKKAKEINTEQKKSKPSRGPGMGMAWLLFGMLFLGGVILQHIMGGKAINGVGGARIPFVVSGLAAFIMTVAAGWHKPWQKFLSSNRFSVPALFVLTIISVLGTLILQGQPESLLDKAYGSAANLIKGLFLDDLFHSIGFALVLGCGAGGLGLVLVRKRKMNLRYLGAVGAHLGLLLILAGAALGNVWVVKGRLNMHVGQKADSFAVPTPDGKLIRYPLGFEISLDDFKLEHYDPEYRVMIFKIDGRKEERLLAVDPAQKKNWPKLEEYGVELEEYWPDHALDTKVEETKDDGQAALQLSSKAHKGSAQTEWTFDSGGPGGGQSTIAGQRVLFFWDEPRAQAYVDSLAQKPSGPQHIILVGKKSVPVEIGQSTPLPDSDHTITAVRAFGDFIIDAQTKQPSNRSDKPNNPAIEVVIKDGAGKELNRKWLFAKFPSFAHQAEKSGASQLSYKFEGTSAAQAPNWIVVGQSGEWWHMDKGTLSEKKTVSQGQSIGIGGVQVRVLNIYANSKRSDSDISRSDKANNPVVKIKPKNGGRSRQMGLKQPLRLNDSQVMVLAPKGGDTVRDYLSTVSVWVDGKKVNTDTVEVNYPLEHDGFVFYQSDYRPDDPTFSGFQVVRDSGLWLVYLGLILNMLGVLLAMFIPVFSARKKKVVQTEGAES